MLSRCWAGPEGSIWIQLLFVLLGRIPAGCTFTKRTAHLLSGMAVGACVSFALGYGFFELVLIGGVFGIAPDFDLALALVWRNAHRSAGSHSLLASGGAAVAWYAALRITDGSIQLLEGEALILASAGVVFLAAFIHALEDSLTVKGCRLLYPFSKKRWRGPVRYDDIPSNLIISMLSVIVILFCSGPY